MALLDAHEIQNKLMYVSFLSQEDGEFARKQFAEELGTDGIWVNARDNSDLSKICTLVVDEIREKKLTRGSWLLVVLYDVRQFNGGAGLDLQKYLSKILGVTHSIRMEIQLMYMGLIPVVDLSGCVQSILELSKSNASSENQMFQKRLFLLARRAIDEKKLPWTFAAALLDLLRRFSNPAGELPYFGFVPYDDVSVLRFDSFHKEEIERLKKRKDVILKYLGGEAPIRRLLELEQADKIAQIKSQFSAEDYRPELHEGMNVVGCLKKARAKKAGTMCSRGLVRSAWKICGTEPRSCRIGFRANSPRRLRRIPRNT